jgi:uncharacterized membrane protein
MQVEQVVVQQVTPASHEDCIPSSALIWILLLIFVLMMVVGAVFHPDAPKRDTTRNGTAKMTFTKDQLHDPDLDDPFFTR